MGKANSLGGPSPPGAAVRALRNAYDLTQEEFGYLVDADAQTVRLWEKERGPMPIEKFELVCMKLDEAPEDWINGPRQGGARVSVDEAAAIGKRAIAKTQWLRAFAITSRPQPT